MIIWNQYEVMTISNFGVLLCLVLVVTTYINNFGHYKCCKTTQRFLDTTFIYPQNSIPFKRISYREGIGEQQKWLSKTTKLNVKALEKTIELKTSQLLHILLELDQQSALIQTMIPPLKDHLTPRIKSVRLKNGKTFKKTCMFCHTEVSQSSLDG